MFYPGPVMVEDPPVVPALEGLIKGPFDRPVFVAEGQIEVVVGVGRLLCAKMKALTGFRLGL